MVLTVHKGHDKDGTAARAAVTYTMSIRNQSRVHQERGYYYAPGEGGYCPPDECCRGILAQHCSFFFGEPFCNNRRNDRTKDSSGGSMKKSDRDKPEWVSDDQIQKRCR